MNETVPPIPTGEPAAPASPRLRSWSRRALRLTLWLALGLLGLIALFHAGEYCRGRWTWHRYSKELVAQGVALHPAQLAPPSVPDDQDFAMTPCLVPLYDYLPGTQTYRDPVSASNCMRLPALPSPGKEPAGDWTRGIKTDLAAWPGALRQADRDPLDSLELLQGAPLTKEALEARLELGRPTPTRFEDPARASTAVLQALQPAAAILDELRTASLRPYCRFNVRYNTESPFDMLLPHLSRLRDCSRILSLRAVSQLVLGQPDAAFEDLSLTLHLVKGLSDEPLLLSQMSRLGMVRSALQVLWEGMVRHQWSPAQLLECARHLGETDSLAAYELGMRAHQASMNRYIAYVRDHPESYGSVADLVRCRDFPSLQWTLGWRLSPRGWLYQEQVNYNRAFGKWHRLGVNLTTRRVSPIEIARYEQITGSAFDALRPNPIQALARSHWFEMIETPVMLKTLSRFAYTQTSVDEALVACALERCRLAAGEYPASLDELTPKFIDKLPHDIITGDPLKYRRTDGGGFVLYSVGWDQQDDGGKLPSSEGGPFADGDWVFRVP